MTIEEFSQTGFHAGMKVRYKGEIRDLVSVDFEENLIGIESGEIECEECGHVEIGI
jgi:hypothetical protein|nr:MAG TPA: zinc ribbon domain protein [Caudoviricetes sp.]